MYSLYVGFILLVLILAFLWVCAAGFFGGIGKIVERFAEPFSEPEDEETEIKNNETKGDNN